MSSRPVLVVQNNTHFAHWGRKRSFEGMEMRLIPLKLTWLSSHISWVSERLSQRQLDDIETENDW